MTGCQQGSLLGRGSSNLAVVWPAGGKCVSGTRGGGALQGLVWKLRRHCGPDGAGGAGWGVLWRCRAGCYKKQQKLGQG